MAPLELSGGTNLDQSRTTCVVKEAAQWFETDVEGGQKQGGSPGSKVTTRICRAYQTNGDVAANALALNVGCEEKNVCA